MPPSFSPSRIAAAAAAGLVLATGCASATKLLLPLYQYPGAGVWDPVYAAVAANPQLDFQIIINADSGPGGGSGAGSPDASFATGVARLKSYANVQTLGYVHCLYGAAAAADVEQNASSWAAWTAQGAPIDGIFFDEVPNNAEEGDSSSSSSSSNDDVAYMSALVTAARASFGSSSSSSSSKFASMLNIGSRAQHDALFDVADYVVVFENAASAYDSATVLAAGYLPARPAQAAILIPHFGGLAADTARAWLGAMVAAGVGTAHILNADYIQATSAEGLNLASVAGMLAEQQPQGSNSSSSSAAAAGGSTTVTATATATATTLAAGGRSSSSSSSSSSDVAAEETGRGHFHGHWRSRRMHARLHHHV